MRLTDLLGSGVGPVSVRPSTMGVTAVFDGHDVECVTEGDTVRLRLEARLLWVGHARAGELRARLSEHALSRPELLMTAVADDGSTVTITLWVDAEPMTPVSLAQAVRTVRRSLAEAEPQLTALGAAIVRDRPASFPARTVTNANVADQAMQGAPSDVQQHQPQQLTPVEPMYDAAQANDVAAPVAVEGQHNAPDQGQQQPFADDVQQTSQPVFTDMQAEQPAPAPEPEPEPEPQPDPEPEPQLDDEPRWGYVQQATEVRGLQDTDVTVGTLVPGQWYELRSSANGWTHVVSVDGAMEGWAAAALLNERRG